MELRDKKILLTGARGFVGRAVCARLQSIGVPEKNIALHSSEKGDLRTKEAAREAVRGAHIIIHLAGITGGILFHRDNANRIYEDNFLMGMNMLGAARESGAEKFVMAGSLTEYGMDAALPLSEDSLWSGDPKPQHAAYARAKREILLEAKKQRAQGLESAHLLLASMYGPGERDDFVIPKLIKKIAAAKREDKPQLLEQGGASTRDFLFVEDAARAILAAAESYDSDTPLNIASGIEVSIRDLALLIGKIIGYEGVMQFESVAERPDRVVADIRRAKKELGWTPLVDLETGLRATIAWHERHV
ncbi:NAD-dependent epimerase/dehydratase family protein [Candidatus Kaiserbacteria bacterium]|nr:NAD-dependent epimerase/dehydratase family protein [Candidatus Kaiserbacteria bacterium]